MPTPQPTCQPPAPPALGPLSFGDVCQGLQTPPAELHQLPVCPGGWSLWLVRGCRALALREEDRNSPSVCSQRSADRSQVEGLLPPSPQGQRSSLLHYPPHILNRINHLHDKQLINYSFLCGVPLLQLMGQEDACWEQSKLWSQVPAPCSLHSQLPAL